MRVCVNYTASGQRLPGYLAIAKTCRGGGITIDFHSNKRKTKQVHLPCNVIIIHEANSAQQVVYSMNSV